VYFVIYWMLQAVVVDICKPMSSWRQVFVGIEHQSVWLWIMSHLPHSAQGDHLSGKLGNVWEFDSCQVMSGNCTKSQGSVMGKMLSGKSCLKLFIEICPYRYLVEVCSVLNIKYMVSDHSLLHSYPHNWQ